MPSSISRRIFETRLALGHKGKPLSQPRFGEMIGVSQAAVSRWESDLDAPTEENLLKLTEIEPSFAEFLPSRVLTLPLYTMVSAGKLSNAETVHAAQLAELRRLPVVGLGKGDFFLLQVDGDSMNRIAPEGSTIVVNRADTELITGRSYIFALDGEATFKRYRAKPLRLEPASHNPEHEAIELENLKGLRVVGRVVKVLFDL